MDILKCYPQLPLHENSGEMHSLQIYNGVYTTTRVPTGAANSVAYAQSTNENLFAEYLYKNVIVWIDDILIFAKTIQNLLDLLQKVLEICKINNLTLKIPKCEFFTMEIKWCGKIISGTGVANDPTKVSALINTPLITPFASACMLTVIDINIACQ